MSESTSTTRPRLTLGEALDVKCEVQKAKRVQTTAFVMFFVGFVANAAVVVAISLQASTYYAHIYLACLLLEAYVWAFTQWTMRDTVANHYANIASPLINEAEEVITALKQADTKRIA